MLICSFLNPDGPRPGIVEGDDLYVLEGSMFDQQARRGDKIGLASQARLLPPVMPGKIICLGLNYADHAREQDTGVPPEPLIFLKPPSAVIGPDQTIELLPDMGKVEHETELGVVIGRQGRMIPQEEALKYVLGYTCGNDVSARDYQFKDGQWARAKSFDTFCPLGPWINTDLDPSDLAITCRVNGETRQDSRTSQMIFGVPFLIEYISRVMTLLPGDVILTGTPAGVSPIQPGDVVEVEVEGVGVLRNPVSMRVE
ncbi:MAG: fumarylacetoacetate hydrolase family protein [Anaerolineae bacterium]|nr:fumarylacetoacetate hydrolase family protein [Anaerolineae bacterium]